MLHSKMLLTAFVLLLTAVPSLAAEYEIDFKLTNSAAYDSIDVKTLYTSAAGDFNGTAGKVGCTANSSLGAIFAANDCETTSQAGCVTARTLYAGVAADAGIAGPTVLYTCRFTASSAPTTGQFSITVTSWSAAHSTPPTVGISRIQVVP